MIEFLIYFALEQRLLMVPYVCFSLPSRTGERNRCALGELSGERLGKVAMTNFGNKAKRL